MSDVTKALLWGGFDFDEMAERRRAKSSIPAAAAGTTGTVVGSA